MKAKAFSFFALITYLALLSGCTKNPATPDATYVADAEAHTLGKRPNDPNGSLTIYQGASTADELLWDLHTNGGSTAIYDADGNLLLTTEVGNPDVIMDLDGVVLYYRDGNTLIDANPFGERGGRGLQRRRQKDQKGWQRALRVQEGSTLSRQVQKR